MAIQKDWVPLQGPIFRRPCPGHCGPHCDNFVTEKKTHVWLNAENMGVTTDEWGMDEECEFEGCSSCFPTFRNN